MANVARLNQDDLAARCEALEADNERLRFRVTELEELLTGEKPIPVWLGLTGKEATIFRMLASREATSTREAIMTVLYGGRDEPEFKTIDVFVCKLRAKVEPYGVLIENEWGRGYFMGPDARKRAKELMDG